MKEFFYISSYGGSATAWIAKSLSLHPEIVCFHGTRNIPPRSNNLSQPEMTPDEFMDGLLTCRKSVMLSKFFGAIHGFYGTIAYESVTKRNGAFASIFRNPVKRIHSLYTHHFETTLHKSGHPYQGMEEDQFNLFKHLCNDTIRFDAEIASQTDIETCFAMEDLVKQPVTYKKLFRIITPQLDISENYIKKIFSIGCFNKHAHISLSPKNTFLLWPPNCQIFFCKTLDAHKKKFN